MSRVAVSKTYKLYIGGKFPRTESGRVDEMRGKDGGLIANMSRASRKDLRAAVEAARAAFGGWSGASAYLRGQIVYRIAEMLEGRTAQFVAGLEAGGLPAAEAKKDVAEAVDLLVYYAGWSDKFQAVFSSVNPVATPHFNFSQLEPVGVVGVLAPAGAGLKGLVSVIAPVLVGGNASVVLAGAGSPQCAISFAEVLATSDVPGGVVNLLTGRREELALEFAKHREFNAFLVCGAAQAAEIEGESAENMKRVSFYADEVLEAGPEPIVAFQETKTTWHPVGF